jgi:hypothetical protein
MASHIITSDARSAAHPTTSSDRFGGWCAVLAAIGGLLYAIAFVVISRSDPALGGLLSALFLMLNGLLTSSVLATLYERLRAVHPTAALRALLLGSAGALGATIHGGYDLANAINPPASANADLPNAIDPRGLLTFGMAGLSLWVIAWLMRRDARMPKGLVYLGFLLAVLLVFIYLARLTILSPANPVLLIPVLLAGFVVNPAWYLWLGIVLLRGQHD